MWGESQASGSKPYQVSIVLGGPAFKCTCPSRKFPCKHGIGLMLLAHQKPDSVKPQKKAEVKKKKIPPVLFRTREARTSAPD